MAVEMRGLADDGALSEARSLSCLRAQLWTHADNARARRLYERTL